jgi:hypothetical protein
MQETDPAALTRRVLALFAAQPNYERLLEKVGRMEARIRSFESELHRKAESDATRGSYARQAKTITARTQADHKRQRTPPKRRLASNLQRHDRMQRDGHRKGFRSLLSWLGRNKAMGKRASYCLRARYPFALSGA